MNTEINITTNIKNIFKNSISKNALILLTLPHCSACNIVKNILIKELNNILSKKNIETKYIDLKTINDEQKNIFINLLNLRFVPVLIVWKNNEVIKVYTENSDINNLNALTSLINHFF